MLFMVIYSFRPENREAATQRFMKTGGPPPEGVEMMGRWHAASMNQGFTLAEANDAESVAKWCHLWADLLTFEVIPVLEDEQITRVLGS
ncbi:MAG: DUF3303 domain-containing protein [Marinifilaceae bacterium]